MPYVNADETFRVPTAHGLRAPMTQFPPVFSLALAFVSKVTTLPVSGGAAALVCGLACVLSAYGLVRLLARQRPAIGLAYGLALATPLLIEPTMMVWAEALKLAVLVAILRAGWSYAERPTTRTFVVLVALSVLAPLVHFSAIAGPIAAAVFLVRQPGRSRVAALVPLVAAAASATGWIVYARHENGGIAEKTVGLYGVTAAEVVVIAVAAAVLAGAIASRDKLTEFAATMAAASFAVVAVAHTFFDRNVSFDARQLQAGVILALFACAAIATKLSARRWLSLAVVAAVVAGPVVAVVSLRGFAHSEYAGYRAARWQHSQLLDAVRTAPLDEWMLTNAPDAVSLLTTHTPIGLPPATNLYTGARNAEYRSELTALACAARTHLASLAFFDRPTRGRARTIDPAMVELLGLRIVTHYQDGTLYAVTSASVC